MAAVNDSTRSLQDPHVQTHQMRPPQIGLTLSMTSATTFTNHQQPAAVPRRSDIPAGLTAR